MHSLLFAEQLQELDDIRMHTNTNTNTTTNTNTNTNT